eukprot:2665146-Amphidinium_carterae.1
MLLASSSYGRGELNSENRSPSHGSTQTYGGLPFQGFRDSAKWRRKENMLVWVALGHQPRSSCCWAACWCRGAPLGSTRYWPSRCDLLRVEIGKAGLIRSRRNT